MPWVRSRLPVGLRTTAIVPRSWVGGGGAFVVTAMNYSSFLAFVGACCCAPLCTGLVRQRVMDGHRLGSFPSGKGLLALDEGSV